MRILVAYASKTGATKGIAEFIAKKLEERGVLVDVQDVSSARGLGIYDAFIVGSGLYQYHWLREAKEFVSKNRAILAARPVWFFSSGPTGPKPTDQKGRDLLEVSGPKEIGELRRWVNPRGHQVFFGALFPDRLTGATGWFAKYIPKDQVGDFRDWGQIESWAGRIADGLGIPVRRLAA